MCSIETLYDAEMINNGMLDNRIERPPVFEILGSGNPAKEKAENMDFRGRKRTDKQFKKRVS